MTANDFKERFKAYSTVELLEVVQNATSYQAIAFEAAKNEIDSRNLTESEIQEAHQVLNASRLKEIERQQRAEQTAKSATSIARKIAEHLNPFQTTTPTPERIIRSVTIVYSIFLLFSLITSFKSLSFYLKQFYQLSPIGLIFVLPHILLTIAIIYFSKHKKIGWILLILFLIFASVMDTAVWIQYVIISNSEIDILSEVSSRYQFTFFLRLLLVIGTIYVMCKESVREMYKISNNRALLVVNISLLLSIFIIYTLY